MPKAHHRICRHYIVKGCYDIICDVTAPHCIGHVTFYYKRSADSLVGGSCLLFIHSSGLTLSPETHGRLVPKNVSHDVSSASPGWSLLPATVIIVLALFNSAMSPAGTSSISTRSRSATLLPVSTTSTGLLHLLVGDHVHRVRSDNEKYSVWPLLCAHHFSA